MSRNDYYEGVGTYYDADAAEFDQRYWKNGVLQSIRASFRGEVKRHQFGEVLEIGIGTGLDLAHFAQVFPDARFSGIDVSPEMCRFSKARMDRGGLHNASVAVGSTADLENLFPGRQFDMVYVFFGALNTVDDLKKAAREIRKSLAPGGVLVLSFVNKWYVAGMVIELLKGRFSAAISRLKPVWGGYSPDRFLPSRCYSPTEIRRAFDDFSCIHRQGYSIMHPAWYYHRLHRMPRKLLRALFWVDGLLNRTFLWKFGEYTLFTFKLKE